MVEQSSTDGTGGQTTRHAEEHAAAAGLLASLRVLGCLLAVRVRGRGAAVGLLAVRGLLAVWRLLAVGRRLLTIRRSVGCAGRRRAVGGSTAGGWGAAKVAGCSPALRRSCAVRGWRAVGRLLAVGGSRRGRCVRRCAGRAAGGPGAVSARGRWRARVAALRDWGRRAGVSRGRGRRGRGGGSFPLGLAGGGLYVVVALGGRVPVRGPAGRELGLARGRGLLLGRGRGSGCVAAGVRAAILLGRLAVGLLLVWLLAIGRLLLVLLLGRRRFRRLGGSVCRR